MTPPRPPGARERRPVADLLRGVTLCIFDADDTLRRTTVAGQPCPHNPGEWELLPNVRETLSALPWGGPGGRRIAVASNQDHVGYGIVAEETVRGLLAELVTAATGGAEPDVVDCCPHTREAGCDCRKPAPGMLLRIMERVGARPEETLFVGNHETDREAACRAGVRFAWAEEFFGAQQ